MLRSTSNSPRKPPQKTATARASSQAVERWFAAQQRDLPWRKERTGYTALVSEAMLQQTQVARVIEKYESFMRRFPDVAALAAADEQDVLASWQGLGYYGRAKRLHAAAQAIVARFDRHVPSDVDLLQTLPGIGRYTAGAIASIAFGQRVPIVDTNVARVLMRLEQRGGTASEPANVLWAWSEAERFVNAAAEPSLLNEGLMELGATVCTAAAPRCAHCPLQAQCKALAGGNPASIPVPVAASVRKRVYHHAIVFIRGGKVLLVQRPERGLWASMWQVPTVESEALLPVEQLIEALGAVAPQRIEREREFAHQTSHRDVVFVVHRGRTRSRRGMWIDLGEISSFALSNPMRAIVRAASG